MNIKLFVDACGVDLDVEFVEKHDIGLLYPYIDYNGQDHPSDCTYRLIDADDYVSWLNKGKYATISQPAMQIWKDEFEKAFKEGYDILFLSLSKRLSDGYRQSSIAREMLLKEYPERQFEIIDSELSGAGYELYAIKLAEEIEGAKHNSLKDLKECIESKYEKKFQTFWFCPNLNYVYYMQRGSDNFKDSGIPSGSPVMVTDFEGSFHCFAISGDMETSFKGMVNEFKNVEAWLVNYAPDYKGIDQKIEILTRVIGLDPHYHSTWMGPTNVAIAGPGSFSVGIMW